MDKELKSKQANLISTLRSKYGLTPEEARFHPNGLLVLQMREQDFPLAIIAMETILITNRDIKYVRHDHNFHLAIIIN